MEELTGLDARFLYSETPTAHMHTIKVVVVDVTARDGVLTPELLVAAFARRLDRMPVLRRRVVPVPHRVSHPVWVEVPVDPDDHIVWRRLEPPGDRDSLSALVAEIAGVPLRRDRPLWELTVVEGLADGRLAFVVKLHHALADGVAVAAMLANVFGEEGAPVVAEPARPEPMPVARQLRRQAVRNRLHRAVRLPGLLLANVTGLLAAGRSREARAVRPPAPFTGPRSTFNVALSDQRTFAVADLALDDILRLRAVHGVTVNDVFLAVCSGALRAHLGQPATRRRGLTAAVPIGSPGDDARLSGNRLDHMLVALRTDIDDPVARLQAIAQGAAAGRAERALLGRGLFEARAAHTPPVLYPLAMRLWAASRLANRLRPPVNLIISNVIGPRVTLELKGGVVDELWSVGPILEGIGLNLTAWSYDGVLRVSVLGCPESLPDAGVLVARLEEALVELDAATNWTGSAPSPADHDRRPDAVRA